MSLIKFAFVQPIVKKMLKLFDGHFEVQREKKKNKIITIPLPPPVILRIELLVYIHICLIRSLRSKQIRIKRYQLYTK